MSRNRPGNCSPERKHSRCAGIPADRGPFDSNRCKLRSLKGPTTVAAATSTELQPTADRANGSPTDEIAPRPIRPGRTSPPRQDPREPPACSPLSADRQHARRQAATARAHSPSPAYPGASLRPARGAKPSSAYAPQIPGRVGRSPTQQHVAIRSDTDPDNGPPGQSPSSTRDPPHSTPRPASSTAAPAPPSPGATESPKEHRLIASHNAVLLHLPSPHLQQPAVTRATAKWSAFKSTASTPSFFSDTTGGPHSAYVTPNSTLPFGKQLHSPRHRRLRFHALLKILLNLRRKTHILKNDPVEDRPAAPVPTYSHPNAPLRAFLVESTARPTTRRPVEIVLAELRVLDVHERCTFPCLRRTNRVAYGLIGRRNCATRERSLLLGAGRCAQPSRSAAPCALPCHPRLPRVP